MKEEIENFKKLYGFDKADYKYIPAGSEILKLIGQEVVYVSYNKINDVWDCKTEKAFIVSISDFNPINMTYKCRFVAQSEMDTEQEIRIIPEGYSWSDNGSEDHFVRFVPYSLHCKLVEDELFYGRVKVLYENRSCLPFAALKTISESSEKVKTLRYSNNIAAVIKLNDSDDILYFRVFDIDINHIAGKRYSLSISDAEGREYKMKIENTDDLNDFEFEGIGRLKFIDLSDE